MNIRIATTLVAVVVMFGSPCFAFAGDESVTPTEAAPVEDATPPPVIRLGMDLLPEEGASHFVCEPYFTSILTTRARHRGTLEASKSYGWGVGGEIIPWTSEVLPSRVFNTPGT